MSKITLTPNASGTGTFTVASPNSNTNRTLTLPDEAGELLINGTTSNVGIGTSSPMSVALNVHDSTNARIALTNSSTGQTFPDGFELLATGLDAYLQNRSNGNMIFTTNNAERMRIDSSGNVGIGGTTNSTRKVDIYQTSGNEAGVRVRSTGSGAYYQMFTGTANPKIGSSNNTDQIEFHLGSGEKMRIDSSGNVGIGTTPSTKIDAVGSTSTSSGIVDTLRLRNTGSAFGDGAKIQFTSGVNSTSGAGIGSGGVALNSADLRFYSGGNTERMRITSSGELVNTGSTLPSASVQGFGVQDQTIYTSATSTSTRNHHIFYNGNGIVGSITTSGSSTSYNTSSDYRLKTDTQPMTGASARVQALNPVNFEWIADGTRVDGFLAHEAQAVVPEAVTGTKDAMRDEEYEVTPAVYEDVIIPAVLDDEGNEVEAERTEQQLVTEAVMVTRSVPDYQGIDQSKLVPLLTAALQEALTEISDLKARVVALEAV